MTPRERERELLRISTFLRQMKPEKYARARYIQQQQDEAYKRWLFYKSLRKEMEKSGKIRNI